MKYAVSECEMHPCYFVTPDFSMFCEESGDLVLELTDEEYQRYDKACLEFEEVMAEVMMKIKDMKDEN